MNVNAVRLGCRPARSRSSAGMENLTMGVKLPKLVGRRRDISVVKCPPAESRFVSYCPGGAPTHAN
jgi:hypothetical protein